MRDVFRLYDIQKRYYEEGEEAVKGIMLSMTTGPLLQALQNMDSQEPDSIWRAQLHVWATMCAVRALGTPVAGCIVFGHLWAACTSKCERN